MYEKWSQHCGFFIKKLIRDFLGWNIEAPSDDTASSLSVSTTRRGSANSNPPPDIASSEGTKITSTTMTKA